MGVGAGRHEQNNQYIDFNASDENNKIILNESEKQRRDIKIILFLLMQQNELKLEQENKIDKTIDKKKFFIIKETLENYNKKYDIESISFSLNKTLKLSLKEKFINWEESVNDIIQYTEILKKEQNNINEIKNEMEYLSTNYIKYPSNFSLIEEHFIDNFNTILNEQKYKL